ncbi:16000_t:CDS:2 [Cetraspora pellucida]|uniref:16000_t:CDS:1 n=1 Tax=Cetraspora pellucida TaxID=1433469 RepID=A0A9N9E4A2_9GLOM|nr:16000_t:CDS:2 [Cetraspora pellucida]
MFAPRVENDETIDSYLDIIYGPLIVENSLENIDNSSDSSSTSDNDDIPTAGNRRHWRHVSQQFKQQMKNTYSRSRGQGRVNTKNLIQKVRAAIYLSLDKLWESPNESSLIAMILDPRMKNFSFINGSEHAEQRTQTEHLLRNLYTQLKQGLVNENFEEPILTTDLANNAEDVFSRM